MEVNFWNKEKLIFRNFFFCFIKNILFLCRYEVAPRSDSEDSGSEDEEEEEVHNPVIFTSKQNGHL